MSCSLQMEECNTAICDSVQPLVLSLQNSAVSLSHVSNIGTLLVLTFTNCALTTAARTNALYESLHVTCIIRNEE